MSINNFARRPLQVGGDLDAEGTGQRLFANVLAVAQARRKAVRLPEATRAIETERRCARNNDDVPRSNRESGDDTFCSPNPLGFGKTPRRRTADEDDIRLQLLDIRDAAIAPFGTDIVGATGRLVVVLEVSDCARQSDATTASADVNVTSRGGAKLKRPFQNGLSITR